MTMMVLALALAAERQTLVEIDEPWCEDSLVWREHCR